MCIRDSGNTVLDLNQLAILIAMRLSQDLTGLLVNDLLYALAVLVDVYKRQSLNTAKKRVIESPFFHAKMCLAQDFKSIAQDTCFRVSYLCVTC